MSTAGWSNGEIGRVSPAAARDPRQRAGVRAAHRVRQRREPAAGARVGPAARNRGEAAGNPRPTQRGRGKGNRLIQRFEDASQGRPARLVLPLPSAHNYVYFGGGNIRFGKLTMHDADLQLIDADPTDPFDFYPAQYHAQLVAGYSKNTPAKGLKTFMPDFDDVKRLAAGKSRAAAR